MREYTIAMLLTHGMAAAMTMSIHPIQYNHYYHSNYSYQYIHTPPPSLHYLPNLSHLPSTTIISMIIIHTNISSLP